MPSPAEDKRAKEYPLYCSFCGKMQSEVLKMIAGPTVFICNECIVLCVSVLHDEGIDVLEMATAPAPQEAVGDYTPDQKRVSDYIQEITREQVGSGEDPIGFLIASHRHLAQPRSVAGEARNCTCHPDDHPPVPCARKYALSECRAAAAQSAPAPLWDEGLREILAEEADNEGFTFAASQLRNGHIHQFEKAALAAMRRVQALSRHPLPAATTTEDHCETCKQKIVKGHTIFLTKTGLVHLRCPPQPARAAEDDREILAQELMNRGDLSNKWLAEILRDLTWTPTKDSLWQMILTSMARARAALSGPVVEDGFDRIKFGSLPGYPFLPCPICKGVEGCDHTVPERIRAALSATRPVANGMRLVPWKYIRHLKRCEMTSLPLSGECTCGLAQFTASPPADTSTPNAGAYSALKIAVSYDERPTDWQIGFDNALERLGECIAIAQAVAAKNPIFAKGQHEKRLIESACVAVRHAHADTSAEKKP